MTLTPERIAELRRLHGRSGAPGIRGSASIRAIPELLDEIDRLREALAVKTALLDEAPKNMAKLARIAAILEPLRALEAAATDAPWTVRKALIETDGQYDYGIAADVDGDQRVIAETFGRVSTARFPPAMESADLICAARNALPALLREIQETP